MTLAKSLNDLPEDLILQPQVRKVIDDRSANWSGWTWKYRVSPGTGRAPPGTGRAQETSFCIPNEVLSFLRWPGSE